jgi:hypothetical protein
MVTGALLAARRIHILLITEYACWPIIFGMKYFAYLCIRESGTTLRQKRITIADLSPL